VAPEILGIHHVTAIATDPQTNVDFYGEVLGLRLVKRTVNFDDPGSYHLYYGDERGRPGTILTFFPWPGARRGTRGAGQATVAAFSVPEGSLGWWRDHLSGQGIVVDDPAERFDEEAMTLLDPDGLKLELVAHAGADGLPPWEGGPIPPRFAVRGFHSVTLTEQGYEATAALLTGVLGFRPAGELRNRFRFEVGRPGGPGTRVDVLCSPEAGAGRISAGTLHHVAWRAAGDAQQLAWREKLVERGLDVTPVLDRNYFHSIYFREPGGVLFEIATDPPGFTADEPLERLGSALKLPSWLEPARSRIEAALPPLRGPGEGGGERPG
jgi:glyoxalase family protein